MFYMYVLVFFFSSRRRHTRYWRDWSSDVCSSDLSIMYFFVSSPPKIFCAVNPAFSAMSVKVAMAGAGAASGLACCANIPDARDKMQLKVNAREPPWNRHFIAQLAMFGLENSTGTVWH